MRRRPVTPRAMRKVLDELEVPEGLVSGPVAPRAIPLGPGLKYTAELGERVLALIREGRGLAEIFSDKTLPCELTVRRWCDRVPAFAEAYKEAWAYSRKTYGTLAGAIAAERAIKFNQDLADQICEVIEAGGTMKDIDKDSRFPSYPVILRWKRENPEFAVAYNKAREASAESCEHNAIEEAMAATDRDSAAVAKIRADQWRWAAAVRSPKTHGNKLDTTVTIEIGLADRLNAAVARLGSAGREIEGEIIGATALIGSVSAPLTRREKILDAPVVPEAPVSWILED